MFYNNIKKSVLVLIFFSAGCQCSAYPGSDKISIIVEEQGYVGPMRIKVEFRDEKMLGKVEVMSHSETSPYVTDDKLDNFLDSLRGRDILTLKEETDAISGATKTSSAVLRAVRRAREEAFGNISSTPGDNHKSKERLKKFGLDPRKARYWKEVE